MSKKLVAVFSASGTTAKLAKDLAAAVDASCQIIEGKVNASAAEIASWDQSMGL